MENEERLLNIIAKYRNELQKKIQQRQEEMLNDNNAHYIVYNVLGFSSEEGFQIDYQQNVGRFLYKYAGSLLEELVIDCFKITHPNAKEKVKLPNTIDRSPQNIEISFDE